MNEKDFFEYVEAICRRPKMYTTNGTFFETVSFLDGLAAGLNVGKEGYHMPLAPFRHWLRCKYDSSQESYDWKDFREKYSTDHQALVAFADLYREYIFNKE